MSRKFDVLSRDRESLSRDLDLRASLFLSLLLDLDDLRVFSIRALGELVRERLGLGDLKLKKLSEFVKNEKPRYNPRTRQVFNLFKEPVEQM